jgi:quercetin dioxygenase-like cupin family protein
MAALEDNMDMSERPHVTAERPLDGAWLSFDLPVMLKRIKAEETWRLSSRNAMTLMKSRGQRIVLIAMHGKTEIPMHRADGQLSLQVIQGSLRVHTDAQAITLGKGELLALHAEIPHAIEAIRESAFLLTLSTEAAHPAEQ